MRGRPGKAATHQQSESQNMKYAMQKTWFITAPAEGLALKSQKLPCRPAIRLWQLAAAAPAWAKHSGGITKVFSRSCSTLRRRIRRKRPVEFGQPRRHPND